MQIEHRIGLTADEQDQRDLARIGLTVGTGFVYFDVAESSDSWPAIRDWVARRRPSDFPRTFFSKQEIAEARWLELASDWHHGYPQPDDGAFGYLEATYDLTDYCPACGVGLRQKAPFQMKGEPRWGRRAILQLNWVFDEYFVRPEVWAEVFRPQGIGRRAVTNRRGIELETVVQLVVEETVSLEAAGLPAETCGTCGRLKYLPVQRGPLPPLVAEPSGHMAKTEEYFGSGASAFHEVLISQVLARAIEQADVRGVSLRPVASEATRSSPV